MKRLINKLGIILLVTVGLFSIVGCSITENSPLQTKEYTHYNFEHLEHFYTYLSIEIELGNFPELKREIKQNYVDSVNNNEFDVIITIEDLDWDDISHRLIPRFNWYGEGGGLDIMGAQCVKRTPVSFYIANFEIECASN